MREGRGFYDTNVLMAYLFREEDRFGIAKTVLERHVVKALSITSIHEIHAYSIKFNVEDRFVKVKELLHKLFKIEPLEQDVCTRASYLRRDYGLPEIDSLILATVTCFGYDHFYIFDRDFEKLNNKVVEGTVIHYLTHHTTR